MEVSLWREFIGRFEDDTGLYRWNLQLDYSFNVLSDVHFITWHFVC